MPTLFQPGWGFSRYSLTLPKLREENRARKILTIEGRGGGEDPGKLQQPQGRDPAAAHHPTLALGRHHHSHYHVNATITNRVRESQRGKDRGRALHSWAEREREREREQLQSWNAGGAVWGKGGSDGGINCLFIYIYYSKSKGQRLRQCNCF